MTVFVKKVQNNNRKMEKAYGKWYGRAVVLKEVGIEAIADEIQENCTAKRSDVLAVLSELGPAIKKEIQNSFKVRIPYLGTFKLGVSTEGVDKSEDFDIRNCLKDIHVLFRPEYTVEQGHSIKMLTLGAKVAELPKGIRPNGDDDGAQVPGEQNQGSSVVEDQP